MAAAYPSPAPSPVSASPTRPPPAKPRVAVVGSGLAGLTAAYLLCKEGADVWVIEKATQLGFHAWSVELEANGKPTTSMSAGEASSHKEKEEREMGYIVPNPKSTPSSLLPPSPQSPRRRTSSSSSRPSRPSSPLPSPSLYPAPSVPTTLSTSSASASASASAPSSPATNGSKGGIKRTASMSLRGDTVAIDVPMRSFQGGYYPLLIALYSHLRLPMQPSHFSFSFASLRPRRKATSKEDTYFIHSGASGASLPSVPANAWRNPIAFAEAVCALLIAGICYLAILVTAFLSWHGLLPSHLGGDATFLTVVDSVSAFLDKPVRRLPRTRLGPHFKAFAADVVLPLFSAVGTMTAEDVWSTPAVHILDYIHAGLGTAHYALGGGRSARDVARLLAAPVRKQGDDRLRLGSGIRAIKYNGKNGGGSGCVTVALDGGAEIDVDCVVIATPARAARHLLGTFEPSLAVHGEKAQARRVARMRTALADVSYRDTIVTTHRDKVVLPPAADVRDINLVQPQVSEAYSSDATEKSSLGLSLHNEVDLAATPLTPTPSSHFPVHQLGEAPFFPPTPQAIYTMATHVIHPNGSSTIPPVYQTTNPVVPIDPDTVLGVARLERALPLRDARTLAGLNPPTGTGTTTTNGTLGPRPLVYLAGSYAYPGIPLLEGCVGSARRVVEDFFALPPQAATGGVDWEAGRGGWLGRLWRWRRTGRGGY